MGRGDQLRKMGDKIVAGAVRKPRPVGWVEKVAKADYFASYWLAEGNERAERGERERAERCYDKSTYWLARLNKLLGNS